MTVMGESSHALFFNGVTDSVLCPISPASYTSLKVPITSTKTARSSAPLLSKHDEGSGTFSTTSEVLGSFSIEGWVIPDCGGVIASKEGFFELAIGSIKEPGPASFKVSVVSDDGRVNDYSITSAEKNVGASGYTGITYPNPSASFLTNNTDLDKYSRELLHVAGVFNKNRITILVNGEIVASLKIPESSHCKHNSNPLYIGGKGGEYRGFIEGVHWRVETDPSNIYPMPFLRDSSTIGLWRFEEPVEVEETVFHLKSALNAGDTVLTLDTIQVQSLYEIISGKSDTMPATYTIPSLGNYQVGVTTHSGGATVVEIPHTSINLLINPTSTDIETGKPNGKPPERVRLKSISSSGTITVDSIHLDFDKSPNDGSRGILHPRTAFDSINGLANDSTTIILKSDLLLDEGSGSPLQPPGLGSQGIDINGLTVIDESHNRNHGFLFSRRMSINETSNPYTVTSANWSIDDRFQVGHSGRHAYNHVSGHPSMRLFPSSTEEIVTQNMDGLSDIIRAEFSGSALGLIEHVPINSQISMYRQTSTTKPSKSLTSSTAKAVIRSGMSSLDSSQDGIIAIGGTGFDIRPFLLKGHHYEGVTQTDDVYNLHLTPETESRVAILQTGISDFPYMEIHYNAVDLTGDTMNINGPALLIEKTVPSGGAIFGDGVTTTVAARVAAAISSGMTLHSPGGLLFISKKEVGNISNILAPHYLVGDNTGGQQNEIELDTSRTPINYTPRQSTDLPRSPPIGVPSTHADDVSHPSVYHRMLVRPYVPKKTSENLFTDDVYQMAPNSGNAGTTNQSSHLYEMFDIIDNYILGSDYVLLIHPSHRSRTLQLKKLSLSANDPKDPSIISIEYLQSRGRVTSIDATTSNQGTSIHLLARGLMDDIVSMEADFFGRGSPNSTIVKETRPDAPVVTVTLGGPGQGAVETTPTWDKSPLTRLGWNTRRDGGARVTNFSSTSLTVTPLNNTSDALSSWGTYMFPVRGRIHLKNGASAEYYNTTATAFTFEDDDQSGTGRFINSDGVEQDTFANWVTANALVKGQTDIILDPLFDGASIVSDGTTINDRLFQSIGSVAHDYQLGTQYASTRALVEIPVFSNQFFDDPDNGVFPGPDNSMKIHLDPTLTAHSWAPNPVGRRPLGYVPADRDVLGPYHKNWVEDDSRFAVIVTEIDCSSDGYKFYFKDLEKAFPDFNEVISSFRNITGVQKVGTTTQVANTTMHRRIYTPEGEWALITESDEDENYVLVNNPLSTGTSGDFWKNFSEGSIVSNIVSGDYGTPIRDDITLDSAGNEFRRPYYYDRANVQTQGGNIDYGLRQYVSAVEFKEGPTANPHAKKIERGGATFEITSYSAPNAGYIGDNLPFPSGVLFLNTSMEAINQDDQVLLFTHHADGDKIVVSSGTPEIGDIYTLRGLKYSSGATTNYMDIYDGYIDNLNWRNTLNKTWNNPYAPGGLRHGDTVWMNMHYTNPHAIEGLFCKSRGVLNEFLVWNGFNGGRGELGTQARDSIPLENFLIGNTCMETAQNFVQHVNKTVELNWVELGYSASEAPVVAYLDPYLAKEGHTRVLLYDVAHDREFISFHDIHMQVQTGQATPKVNGLDVANGFYSQDKNKNKTSTKDQSDFIEGAYAHRSSPYMEVTTSGQSHNDYGMNDAYIDYGLSFLGSSGRTENSTVKTEDPTFINVYAMVRHESQGGVTDTYRSTFFDTPDGTRAIPAFLCLKGNRANTLGLTTHSESRLQHLPQWTQMDFVRRLTLDLGEIGQADGVSDVESAVYEMVRRVNQAAALQGRSAGGSTHDPAPFWDDTAFDGDKGSHMGYLRAHFGRAVKDLDGNDGYTIVIHTTVPGASGRNFCAWLDNSKGQAQYKPQFLVGHGGRFRSFWAMPMEGEDENMHPAPMPITKNGRPFAPITTLRQMVPPDDEDEEFINNLAEYETTNNRKNSEMATGRGANTVYGESFESQGDTTRMVEGLRTGTPAVARINFGGLVASGVPGWAPDAGFMGFGIANKGGRFDKIYNDDSTTAYSTYITQDEQSFSEVGKGELYGFRFADHRGTDHTIRLVYRERGQSFANNTTVLPAGLENEIIISFDDRDVSKGGFTIGKHMKGSAYPATIDPGGDSIGDDITTSMTWRGNIWNGIKAPSAGYPVSSITVGTDTVNIQVANLWYTDASTSTSLDYLGLLGFPEEGLFIYTDNKSSGQSTKVFRYTSRSHNSAATNSSGTNSTHSFYGVTSGTPDISNMSSAYATISPMLNWTTIVTDELIAAAVEYAMGVDPNEPSAFDCSEMYGPDGRTYKEWMGESAGSAIQVHTLNDKNKVIPLRDLFSVSRKRDLGLYAGSAETYLTSTQIDDGVVVDSGYLPKTLLNITTKFRGENANTVSPTFIKSNGDSVPTSEWQKHLRGEKFTAYAGDHITPCINNSMLKVSTLVVGTVSANTIPEFYSSTITVTPWQLLTPYDPDIASIGNYFSELYTLYDSNGNWASYQMLPSGTSGIGGKLTQVNAHDEFSITQVQSTAEIRFWGGAQDIPDGETITIISTDLTSRTYTARDDADYANNEFDRTYVGGGDYTAQMESLKGAIEHASGHNGKILVTRDISQLVFIQAVGGTSGNTTIVETFTHVNIDTQFTGGAENYLSLWGPSKDQRAREFAGQRLAGNTYGDPLTYFRGAHNSPDHSVPLYFGGGFSGVVMDINDGTQNDYTEFYSHPYASGPTGCAGLQNVGENMGAHAILDTTAMLAMFPGTPFLNQHRGESQPPFTNADALLAPDMNVKSGSGSDLAGNTTQLVGYDNDSDKATRYKDDGSDVDNQTTITHPTPIVLRFAHPYARYTDATSGCADEVAYIVFGPGQSVPKNIQMYASSGVKEPTALKTVSAKFTHVYHNDQGGISLRGSGTEPGKYHPNEMSKGWKNSGTYTDRAGLFKPYLPPTMSWQRSAPYPYGVLRNWEPACGIPSEWLNTEFNSSSASLITNHWASSKATASLTIAHPMFTQTGSDASHYHWHMDGGYPAGGNWMDNAVAKNPTHPTTGNRLPDNQEHSINSEDITLGLNASMFRVGALALEDYDRGLTENTTGDGTTRDVFVVDATRVQNSEELATIISAAINSYPGEGNLKAMGGTFLPSFQDAIRQDRYAWINVGKVKDSGYSNGTTLTTDERLPKYLPEKGWLRVSKPGTGVFYGRYTAHDDDASGEGTFTIGTNWRSGGARLESPTIGSGTTASNHDAAAIDDSWDIYVWSKTGNLRWSNGAPEALHTADASTSNWDTNVFHHLAATQVHFNGFVDAIDRTRPVGAVGWHGERYSYLNSLKVAKTSSGHGVSAGLGAWHPLLGFNPYGSAMGVHALNGATATYGYDSSSASFTQDTVGLNSGLHPRHYVVVSNEAELPIIAKADRDGLLLCGDMLDKRWAASSKTGGTVIASHSARHNNDRFAAYAHGGPHVDAQFAKDFAAPSSSNGEWAANIPTAGEMYPMESCLFPTGDLFFDRIENPGVAHYPQEDPINHNDIGSSVLAAQSAVLADPYSFWKGKSAARNFFTNHVVWKRMDGGNLCLPAPNARGLGAVPWVWRKVDSSYVKFGETIYGNTRFSFETTNAAVFPTVQAQELAHPQLAEKYPVEISAALSIPNEEIQFEAITVVDDAGQEHEIEGGSPLGTVIRDFSRVSDRGVEGPALAGSGNEPNLKINLPDPNTIPGNIIVRSGFDKVQAYQHETMGTGGLQRPDLPDAVVSTNFDSTNENPSTNPFWENEGWERVDNSETSGESTGFPYSKSGAMANKAPLQTSYEPHDRALYFHLTKMGWGYTEREPLGIVSTTTDGVTTSDMTHNSLTFVSVSGTILTASGAITESIWTADKLNETGADRSFLTVNGHIVSFTGVSGSTFTGCVFSPGFSATLGDTMKPSFYVPAGSTRHFAARRLRDHAEVSGESPDKAPIDWVSVNFTDETCDTSNTDATVTMVSTSALVVGMGVQGTGIPVGATVASITNSTTFELSAAATATNSNTTLTFGAIHTPAKAIRDDRLTPMPIPRMGHHYVTPTMAVMPGHLSHPLYQRVYNLNRAYQSATTSIEQAQGYDLIERSLIGIIVTDNTCDLTNNDATITMDSTVGLIVGMTVTHSSAIPAGTTIASITNSTTFELSANATATGVNQTFTFSDPNLLEKEGVGNNALMWFSSPSSPHPPSDIHGGAFTLMVETKVRYDGYGILAFDVENESGDHRLKLEAGDEYSTHWNFPDPLETGAYQIIIQPNLFAQQLMGFSTNYDFGADTGTQYPLLTDQQVATVIALQWNGTTYDFILAEALKADVRGCEVYLNEVILDIDPSPNQQFTSLPPLAVYNPLGVNESTSPAWSRKSLPYQPGMFQLSSPGYTLTVPWWSPAHTSAAGTLTNGVFAGASGAAGNSYNWRNTEQYHPDHYYHFCRTGYGSVGAQSVITGYPTHYLNPYLHAYESLNPTCTVKFADSANDQILVDNNSLFPEVGYAYNDCRLSVTAADGGTYEANYGHRGQASGVRNDTTNRFYDVNGSTQFWLACVATINHTPILRLTGTTRKPGAIYTDKQTSVAAHHMQDLRAGTGDTGTGHLPDAYLSMWHYNLGRPMTYYSDSRASMTAAAIDKAPYNHLPEHYETVHYHDFGYVASDGPFDFRGYGWDVAGDNIEDADDMGDGTDWMPQARTSGGLKYHYGAFWPGGSRFGAQASRMDMWGTAGPGWGRFWDSDNIIQETGTATQFGYSTAAGITDSISSVNHKRNAAFGFRFCIRGPFNRPRAALWSTQGFDDTHDNLHAGYRFGPYVQNDAVTADIYTPSLVANTSTSGTESIASGYSGIIERITNASALVGSDLKGQQVRYSHGRRMCRPFGCAVRNIVNDPMIVRAHQGDYVAGVVSADTDITNRRRDLATALAHYMTDWWGNTTGEEVRRLPVRGFGIRPAWDPADAYSARDRSRSPQVFAAPSGHGKARVTLDIFDPSTAKRVGDRGDGRGVRWPTVFNEDVLQDVDTIMDATGLVLSSHTAEPSIGLGYIRARNDDLQGGEVLRGISRNLDVNASDGLLKPQAMTGSNVERAKNTLLPASQELQEPISRVSPRIGLDALTLSEVNDTSPSNYVAVGTEAHSLHTDRVAGRRYIVAGGIDTDDSSKVVGDFNLNNLSFSSYKPVMRLNYTHGIWPMGGTLILDLENYIEPVSDEDWGSSFTVQKSSNPYQSGDHNSMSYRTNTTDKLIRFLLRPVRVLDHRHVEVFRDQGNALSGTAGGKYGLFTYSTPSARATTSGRFLRSTNPAVGNPPYAPAYFFEQGGFYIDTSSTGPNIPGTEASGFTNSLKQTVARISISDNTLQHLRADAHRNGDFSVQPRYTQALYPGTNLNKSDHSGESSHADNEVDG